MEITRTKLSRMINRGMTYKEMSEACKVPVYQIQNWIKKYHLQSKVIEIDAGKAKALKDAGWTIKDIASDMRTNEEEVRRCLKL